MTIAYEWRGAFESREVEALHSEGFDHDAVDDADWQKQVRDHSLGWVCARTGGQLVGFVNVAWDGASHAFILDTIVAESARRQGVGTELVSVAITHARAAGCEWLHVDFEDHLKSFYFGACGFTPTNAGLIQLKDTIGRVDEFVPSDFDVPRRLETAQFVLEPLGPEHNDEDYDAWTSSVEHIHATPGWETSSWPREMTPDENRADLQRHADDFRNRTGFTYTVLDPASRDVIGCVYIYPLSESEYDARALSWVRASHAQLDTPLWRAVSDWLVSEWPFGRVDYAPRA